MAQSPVAVIHRLRPKSGRKPLQPRNIPASILIDDGTIPNPKPSKQGWIDISSINGLVDKENHPMYATPTKKIELFDASLAEELSAFKKKLERLRLDKEKTENMLKERDMALECWMKELDQRSESQKMLEIEVDRLFRLKELRNSCMRVSPIRSLREKEGEKNSREAQLQDKKTEDKEDFADSALQSPSWESSEISTEI